MKGIGGGNFLVLGNNIESVLGAVERAVKKMNKVKNVIQINNQCKCLRKTQNLAQKPRRFAWAVALPSLKT